MVLVTVQVPPENTVVVFALASHPNVGSVWIGPSISLSSKIFAAAAVSVTIIALVGESGASCAGDQLSKATTIYLYSDPSIAVVSVY